MNVPFVGLNSIANLATNGGAGGFSYAAQFMNFDATASALEKDSRFRVLSRPRIQTSHAVEANLFVGQTRPYVTGSYSYFGGGPQTQFQQQQIGLTLSVLPLINAEGLVVLDIRAKVQDIGADVKIDANFSVPATIDREANSKVAVRDGETIMLGGFISNSKRATRDGIPLLKDIPIPGALFRVNHDDQQRRELLILLRPTVLPTPEKAAIFASEERTRLPATRSAEREFREEERKRNEAESRRFDKQTDKRQKKEKEALSK